ncbi:MAG: hypothetical protein MMC23_002741 [Stictis urceolatum]|nr:hypothetical protein [Stictis urceolata]
MEPDRNNLQIVVAHYNEGLDIFQPHMLQTLIYTKSAVPANATIRATPKLLIPASATTSSICCANKADSEQGVSGTDILEPPSPASSAVSEPDQYQFSMSTLSTVPTSPDFMSARSISMSSSLDERKMNALRLASHGGLASSECLSSTHSPAQLPEIDEELENSSPVSLDALKAIPLLTADDATNSDMSELYMNRKLGQITSNSAKMSGSVPLPYERLTFIEMSKEPWKVKAFPCSQAVRLENFGRDCHTYLHHIVHNYDKLAEITLFTQADPFDHAEKDVKIENMIAKSYEPTCGGVRPFSADLKSFEAWAGMKWENNPKEEGWMGKNGRPERSVLNPAEFWMHITGEDDYPARIWYTPGAIFAVERGAVHSRAKEVWQKALDYFNEKPNKNPEVGVFMERFWLPLLSDGYQSKARLSEIKKPATIATDN